MQSSLLWASVAWALSAAPVVKAPEKEPVVMATLALIQFAELPAWEAGALVEFEATEGLQVEKGAVLAQIDDKLPLLQLEARKKEHESAVKKAANDVNERFAAKSAAVAKVEHEKALAAAGEVRNAVTQVELNRLKLTWEKSDLQIEQAELEQEMDALAAATKKAELDAAQLGIERRKITAPFGGVVTEVSRHVGEWVAPGDGVLKLVQIDRLRVIGELNADEYSPDEVDGRPVTVVVHLARGRKETVAGKISFVSPEVFSGGKFRVWAEIDNLRDAKGNWVLRSGLRATMTIHIK